MKNCLLLLILALSFSSQAQTNYKITYLRSSNGKLLENQDPILVFTNESETVILNQKIVDKKPELPFEITLLDRKKPNQVTTLGNLDLDKKIATVDSTSLAKQNFEFSNERRTILGYTCKKAKTIINSNTIELWYTTDLTERSTDHLGTKFRFGVGNEPKKQLHHYCDQN